MSDEKRLQSAVGVGGRRSHRSYTPAEVAAAKRLGFVHGSPRKDRLGGPIFWATGPSWLDKARQRVKDSALVLAAMEREWGKEGNGE